MARGRGRQDPFQVKKRERDFEFQNVYPWEDKATHVTSSAVAVPAGPFAIRLWNDQVFAKPAPSWVHAGSPTWHPPLAHVG